MAADATICICAHLAQTRYIQKPCAEMRITMIGIYFSGTGNSKYCIEKFLEEYGNNSPAFSIEQTEAITHIKNHAEIVICYPVQFSNIPKIVHDYIVTNRQLWKGKMIFIIATMGLFSGDGAGMLARLLQKYGAIIIGGLHLKMPDSISDEKALKRSPEKNVALVGNTAVAGSRCTMCYRCISKCPKQAITLLGKKVIEQNDVNKYLSQEK